MSDQVKFVGVHRERENGGEGLYNSWEYIDREKERERRTGDPENPEMKKCLFRGKKQF